MNGRDDTRLAPSRDSGVNHRLVASLTSLSQGCCILVGVVGLVVLLGWALDTELLKSASSAYVATNPTSALLLMLAGTALWLQHKAWRRPSASLVMRRAVGAAAIAVAGVGAVTLAGYVLGRDLGLVALVFGARLGGNRMA